MLLLLCYCYYVIIVLYYVLLKSIIRLIGRFLVLVNPSEKFLPEYVHIFIETERVIFQIMEEEGQEGFLRMWLLESSYCHFKFLLQ